MKRKEKNYKDRTNFFDTQTRSKSFSDQVDCLKEICTHMDIGTHSRGRKKFAFFLS